MGTNKYAMEKAANRGFYHYTLENILTNRDYTNKHTKNISTIGPACDSVETLVQMIDRGMNVARLNFSHGDHESHHQTVLNLRAAFKQRRDKPVAIMLDTKGPEIRTGKKIKGGSDSITYVKDSDVFITTDYETEQDPTTLACSYEHLTTSVQVGSKILVADGKLVFCVKEIKENGVVASATNGATIGSRKNMNLPGCEIKLPTLTEKDKEDITEFTLKNGVTFIALSFARRAQDIKDCRALLGHAGSHVQIISKIENQEGLHNYDEILKESDAIMVARGDLGMEIPAQKVFVAQKWMIKKARKVGKPVITATQMLESMVKSPLPTRAEASDVANAVLDGSDCVMLSGETAGGLFPLQSLEIMGKICDEAEYAMNSAKDFNDLQRHIANLPEEEREQLLPKTNRYQEAIAMAAVQLSFQINSKVIIVITKTGRMAKLLSKYRPNAYIVAISLIDASIKSLTIYFGVHCLRVPSF